MTEELKCVEDYDDEVMDAVRKLFIAIEQHMRELPDYIHYRTHLQHIYNPDGTIKRKAILATAHTWLDNIAGAEDWGTGDEEEFQGLWLSNQPIKTQRPRLVKPERSK
jgi:hypothetical protein